MYAHSRSIKELKQKIKMRSNETLSNLSCKTSNTLRNRNKKGLNLSHLNRILEICPDRAIVEPGVTFHFLCQETLKRGLIPPVVPEFTTITVGGAVMGAALESSSHKFGQVNDICLEYEVILGNGEVVRANPEENRDLFYGLSGSYGTIAILTQVSIRLIPAKPYVHITHHFLKTNDLLAFLTQDQQAGYVEGIMLKEEEGIAITGNMSRTAGKPLFRQRRYWSPWYIEHLLQTKAPEEWMPIGEYLFRLDKGAFWMGQYVLSFPTMMSLLFHLGIPKIQKNHLHPSLLFRLLFGWALESKRLYRIWHRIPNSISEKLFFVHDFYTPIQKVGEIFHSFVRQTDIYPVWLCPLKGTRTPQIFSPHYGNDKLVNIGLYGIPHSPLSIRELSAKLEKEIVQSGGRKMLYSYTYYDRKSFSEIYDEAAYERLRKKYFAEEIFPHIYNKIVM